MLMSEKFTYFGQTVLRYSSELWNTITPLQSVMKTANSSSYGTDKRLIDDFIQSTSPISVVVHRVHEGIQHERCLCYESEQCKHHYGYCLDISKWRPHGDDSVRCPCKQIHSWESVKQWITTLPAIIRSTLWDIVSPVASRIHLASFHSVLCVSFSTCPWFVGSFTLYLDRLTCGNHLIDATYIFVNTDNLSAL